MRDSFTPPARSFFLPLAAFPICKIHQIGFFVQLQRKASPVLLLSASDSHFLPVFKCAVIDLWHVGGAARRGARLKVYRLRFMAAAGEIVFGNRYRRAEAPDAAVSSGWPERCERYLGCVSHRPEMKRSSGGEARGPAPTFDLLFYCFNHRTLMASPSEKGLRAARASACSGMTSWVCAGRDIRSSLVRLKFCPLS